MTGGNVILKAEYSEIKGANRVNGINTNIKTGYIITKISNKGPLEGFADSEGKVIVKPIYETVEKLEIPGDDIYLFVQENGKKGYFKNGKQILNTTYQELAYSRKSIIIKKDR